MLWLVGVDVDCGVVEGFGCVGVGWCDVDLGVVGYVVVLDGVVLYVVWFGVVGVGDVEVVVVC